MTDPNLSHLDAQGRARMVDVSRKAVTRRWARAHARVVLTPQVLAQVRGGSVAKGEVLAVARVAGVQAAKETARLIPLCHPLVLDQVSIDFREQGDDTLEVLSEVNVEARTGVEMEALTAAAVAALTVYDMVKSACRGARITDLELLEKAGGRSGRYQKPGEGGSP